MLIYYTCYLAHKKLYMRIKILNLFAFLMLMGSLWAQEQSFQGQVLDATTLKPISDVNIKVVGKVISVYTNDEGMFSLSTTPDAQVEVSHISYVTKVIAVGNSRRILLTSNKISLDEIIIETDPLDHILHAQVDDEALQKSSQVRSASELFSDIPGFAINKRSAMATEPSFRVFKYEQMNIKYDGGTKIVHACPNRMDPITAHVIPEEVSKIEFIKGPFDVRFGQNVGAIVNMVTRPPIPNEYGLNGSVQTGYEVNGDNLMARGELQYAQEKFDITLNAEHRDFNDYKDGNGVVVPSSFLTDSYSVKAGLNPTQNQRLQVDWRQKFGSDIDHAGLPMDSPKDDSKTLSLDYKIQQVSDKVKSVHFKSYYSFVDHLMTNENRPNAPAMDASTPVNSNTIGGKLEVAIKPSENLLLYSGLDADLIKRDGERTRVIKINPNTGEPFPEESRPVFTDKVWQDATLSDYGIYTQATAKLSKMVNLNGGLRLDFVMAEVADPATDMTVQGVVIPGFETLYGEGFDKVDEQTFSGNIGFTYQLPKGQLQLAYGLGTRSASMGERYIYHFSIGTDGYEYVGNPFLKPEKNHQVELGLNMKTGPLSWGANVFYSKMPDYISAVYKDNDPNFAIVYKSPFPYAKQYVNVDANQMGFDAFMQWQVMEDLAFSADVAYTQGENETFDEPLAQVMPLMAHAGLKYTRPMWWVDFRGTYSAEQDRLSTSFRETIPTPAYQTFDMRTGFKPIKGLVLGANIINIFDEAYYTHMNFSYVNTVDNVMGERLFEPGRSFNLFVKYDF